MFNDAGVRRGRIAGLPILLALALCLPGSLYAQGPLMQPSAVWAPAYPGPTLPADTTTTIPQTHWATGAIIGGATLGLLTAGLASGFCGYGETGEHDCTTRTIVGFLMGAGVGAALGAFIGARFPKHPKPVEEEGFD